MKKILPLIILLLFLFSCKKDKPEEQPQPQPQPGSKNILVINEGNYLSSNASLTVWDLNSGSVTEDAYSVVNGEPLGDVGQSMTEANGKIYIVVNNSKKIVVCDAASFQKTATITGFNSPRYLLPVSSSKAYVTDIYSDTLWIVDLNTSAISGIINCPRGGEQMTMLYGKVYVTNANGNVYVVDASTDAITDSIFLKPGCNSIIDDKNGKLWVTCTGDYISVPGGVFRFDPATLTIEKQMDYPQVSDQPWRLCANAGRDTMYYLTQNVERLSITATALPSSPFINSNGRKFYGLGCDNSDGSIYVSDVINFIQHGKVYRYDQNGTETNNFPTGIIPSYFLFP